MAKRAARQLAETDLHGPISDYLVAQGYTVRSEVADCDITATKGDELIVIELKRRFSTALLIQATRRQRITDSVYVALPRPKWDRTWRGTMHLLKRLELGLILVCLDGKRHLVEVVFHPVPFRRRKRKLLQRAVIREIESRSYDFNLGGSNRRKLVTAYREQAVQIACYLDLLGPLSPRQLRALGAGPKTASILYSDFYGWFDRIARGLYALRPQGRQELAAYPALVRRYRALAQKQTLLMPDPAQPRARARTRAPSPSPAPPTSP
jgi:hypothetical protein